MTLPTYQTQTPTLGSVKTNQARTHPPSARAGSPRTPAAPAQPSVFGNHRPAETRRQPGRGAGGTARSARLGAGVWCERPGPALGAPTGRSPGPSTAAPRAPTGGRSIGGGPGARRCPGNRRAFRSEATPPGAPRVGAELRLTDEELPETPEARQGGPKGLRAGCGGLLPPARGRGPRGGARHVGSAAASGPDTGKGGTVAESPGVPQRRARSREKPSGERGGEEGPGRPWGRGRAGPRGQVPEVGSPGTEDGRRIPGGVGRGSMAGGFEHPLAPRVLRSRLRGAHCDRAFLRLLPRRFPADGRGRSCERPGTLSTFSRPRPSAPPAESGVRGSAVFAAGFRPLSPRPARGPPPLPPPCPAG